MAEVAMTMLESEGGGELVGESKGRSNWPTSLVLKSIDSRDPNKGYAKQPQTSVCDCLAWPSGRVRPAICLLCVNIGDDNILMYSAPTHGYDHLQAIHKIYQRIDIFLHPIRASSAACSRRPTLDAGSIISDLTSVVDLQPLVQLFRD